jgi:hypothetical protein
MALCQFVCTLLAFFVNLKMEPARAVHGIVRQGTAGGTEVFSSCMYRRPCGRQTNRLTLCDVGRQALLLCCRCSAGVLLSVPP